VTLATELQSLQSTTEVNKKLLEEVISQKPIGSDLMRMSSDNISLDSDAMSSAADD